MNSAIPDSVRVSACGSIAFYFWGKSLRAPSDVAGALAIRSDAYRAAARLTFRGSEILFGIVNGPQSNNPALPKLLSRIAK